MPREDFEQITERLHMLFSAQLKREISQKTQNFIVDYLALSVVEKDNALPLLNTLVKTDAGAAGNRFVNIREFKRLRRLLLRQRHIKTELFGSVFCGYSKLVTWCKKKVKCPFACLARMVLMQSQRMKEEVE